MSEESKAFNAKLLFAGKFVESLVPNYDIKQCDPIIAANTGIGNCISKSIIAAAMIERCGISPIPTALSWNKRTHPKTATSILGKNVVHFGHAQLLATNNLAPHTIIALSFNPLGQASDDWELYQFNLADDIYAEVGAEGRIQATELGAQLGFVIGDWYDCGQAYMEAAGLEQSSFHTFSRESIVSGIVAALQERDLLIKFDRSAS